MATGNGTVKQSDASPEVPRGESSLGRPERPPAEPADDGASRPGAEPAAPSHRGAASSVRRWMPIILSAGALVISCIALYYSHSESVLILKAGLLDSLFDPNPQKQAMALELLCQVDRDLCERVAKVTARTDPRAEFRQEIEQVLTEAAEDPASAVREDASKILQHLDFQDRSAERTFANELRRPEIQEKLVAARNSLRMGNTQGRNRAAEALRGATELLRPATRARVRDGLLDEALEDYRSGRRDIALQKFTAVYGAVEGAL